MDSDDDDEITEEEWKMITEWLRWESLRSIFGETADNPSPPPFDPRGKNKRRWTLLREKQKKKRIL